VGVENMIHQPWNGDSDGFFNEMNTLLSPFSRLNVHFQTSFPRLKPRAKC
jgi:hypothetical protein